MELKRFPTAHGILTYREWGEGFPWIALPPWPFSSLAYSGLGTCLPAGQQLVALDLPGLPGGSHTTDTAEPVQAVVHTVSEFLKAYQDHPYGIIGYSLGGFITQLLLQQQVAQPQRVMLISTWNQGATLHRTRQRAMSLYYKVPRRWRLSALQMWFAVYAMRHGMLRALYKNPLTNPLLAELRMHDLDQSVRLVTNTREYSIDIPHLPALPYLILQGEQDAPYVRTDTTRWANMRHALVVTLPKTVHEHVIFHPELTARVWAEWISTST